jgi:hypothetical protein
MVKKKIKKLNNKKTKLEIFLFVAFMFFGVAKILVSPENTVDVFGKIGGAAAQYTTGFYQIVSAFLILMPATAFIGATLMAISMLVAIILHFTILGFEGPFLVLTILAFGLLIISIYVMKKRRRDLFR